MTDEFEMDDLSRLPPKPSKPVRPRSQMFEEPLHISQTGADAGMPGMDDQMFGIPNSDSLPHFGPPDMGMGMSASDFQNPGMMGGDGWWHAYGWWKLHATCCIPSNEWWKSSKPVAQMFRLFCWCLLVTTLGCNSLYPNCHSYP